MKKMKTTIILILALTMVLSLSACKTKNCEICDKIISIQSEINEIKASLAAESVINEGSIESAKNEEKLQKLEKELQSLLQHECSMPIKNVKNQEFTLNTFTGTYTGEWKGSLPSGKGKFEGTYPVQSSSLSYDGEWKNGELNGYGNFVLISDLYDKHFERYYEGDFKNGNFHGQGLLIEIHELYTWQVEGEFQDGLTIGQAAFKEYDANGNLTDDGIVEGPDQTIIQSSKAERAKEEAQRAEEESKELLGDLGNALLDNAY